MPGEISFKKYSKALEVVLQYHEELETPTAGVEQTPMEEFLRFCRQPGSPSPTLRLTKILLMEYKANCKIFEYVEDVNENIFLKYRGTGPKTWTEFTFFLKLYKASKTLDSFSS